MERMNPAWRKSRYSGNGANCVEAGNAPGVVLVRDTTQHGTGPVLRVTAADWTRLVKSVKDLPARISPRADSCPWGQSCAGRLQPVGA
jgi:Domain of unknown function (DUF397)